MSVKRGRESFLRILLVGRGPAAWTPPEAYGDPSLPVLRRGDRDPPHDLPQFPVGPRSEEEHMPVGGREAVRRDPHTRLCVGCLQDVLKGGVVA